METTATQPSSLAAFYKACPGTKRSLENPSFSLADPANWSDSFASETSATGIKINPQSALRYSPWWRGINLISSDVAKLPLFVYRREGEAKKRAKEHPAFQILRYRANDELMSAFTFKQTLQAWAMSAGNGYAWIRRSGDATPLEMIVLVPNDCWPIRESGRLWYVVRVENEWRRVSPVNIFHIKGLSPDGLVGYSVYAKAREVLGKGMAAIEYGSRFFKNAARPSVVIEVPSTMGDEAQRTFLQQWERMNTGLESAHRTAILTNGAKINPFSTNARDSQLQETSEFNLVDIANFIGVPVHKVGGKGRTAYASLEQENQAYLDESLDPWLIRWEDEAREKLLTEEEKDRDTHVVEFARQALVRADITARYSAHNIAIRGGWESPDEARNIENLPPLPDGQGKKFYVPLDLKEVDDSQPPAVDDLPALMAVTDAVVNGSVPHDTAKAMLAAAFPLLTAQQINSIIDPLKVVEEPEPVEEPPTVPEDPQEPEQPEVAATDAVRKTVIEAAHRVCTHLRTRTIKRSKANGSFMQLMNQDAERDRTRVSKLLSTPTGLCMAMTGCNRNASPVDFIMNELHDTVLAAVSSEQSRDELAQEVERRMNHFLETLPERVADLLLPKGQSDGTSLPAE